MASPSSLRQAVLSSYRGIIRAANLAFKGDDLAIAESHKQIRKHFEESRGVSDEDEVRSLVDDAKEAAEVLRNLVVQSQIDEAGNLKLKARPEHSNVSGSGMGVALEPADAPAPRRKRTRKKDDDNGAS